ncbi:LysE family translocator [Leclercia adecarboxylata]|uniref:LysE family translocator n=1 Tax=Leclercia adecarboxylata TaxID=83655 RepID=A0A9X3YDE0_9ENTR|nr:LysE family translocator [Leclercia adecarboxylata]MBD1405759.1 LysE family translocator [Leclercia adecarboxylata]MDC6623897.1 LysE family translocator [Leclercia adecarboxylata]MDC6632719.1 LysE family translocator [Leclercia adecarboxylata]MDC6639904.1 LysE family translocator [Leclercia adecarboxylata]MDC6651603.1 LysE family translocator [Leclercia adecarboxylata]
MELLTTLFPPAFLALALAHFVALLSPGPDFFLLMGFAARHRLRGSAGLCVGIAAGNGLYILLVIVGSSALRQFTPLFSAIELLGALYLLWIGWHLVRSQPGTLALNHTESASPGWRRQLLLGLGSAVLNPKNALFYLALMTALLGPDVTLLQQSVSGIWMVTVVLVWDLAVVMFIALPSVQRRLSNNIWKIERLAGVVLMVFGAGILWRFFTSV